MTRILVIDDDEQHLAVLKKILEKEAYAVECAPNGRLGMIAFQNKPADLIVTDLIMPEQDGVETISRLKEDYPEVKVIAFSGGDLDGKGLSNYPELAMEFGADMFLTKPLRRKTLLREITRLLT